VQKGTPASGMAKAEPAASGVSGLSRSRGLHSDRLVGVCTPFRRRLLAGRAAQDLLFVVILLLTAEKSKKNSRSRSVSQRKLRKELFFSNFEFVLISFTDSSKVSNIL